MWHSTLSFGADPTAAKWLFVWLLVYLQSPELQGDSYSCVVQCGAVPPRTAPPAMVYSEVKVAQWCLTLCDPWTCIVHGILQARILEWVAFPFFRGPSQPRDWTQVSRIAGGFFTVRATRVSPRILGWAAHPFSRGSSWPRTQTRVSRIVGGFFTSWGTREALWINSPWQKRSVSTCEKWWHQVLKKMQKMHPSACCWQWELWLFLKSNLDRWQSRRTLSLPPQTSIPRSHLTAQQTWIKKVGTYQKRYSITKGIKKEPQVGSLTWLQELHRTEEADST